MLGKINLKKEFHEMKKVVEFKNETLDQMIIYFYQNHNYTKDESKEIALCFYYDYGFLYK